MYIVFFFLLCCTNFSYKWTWNCNSSPFSLATLWGDWGEQVAEIFTILFRNQRTGLSPASPPPFFRALPREDGPLSHRLTWVPFSSWKYSCKEQELSSTTVYSDRTNPLVFCFTLKGYKKLWIINTPYQWASVCYCTYLLLIYKLK